jgi:hypothetical protein
MSICIVLGPSEILTYEGYAAGFLLACGLADGAFRAA